MDAFDQSSTIVHGLPVQIEANYRKHDNTGFSGQYHYHDYYELIYCISGELENDSGLNDCRIMTVYEEIFEFSKITDNIHRGAFGVNDGLHLNDLGQTLLSMTLLRKFTVCKLSEVLSYTNKDFTNKAGLITMPE